MQLFSAPMLLPAGDYAAQAVKAIDGATRRVALITTTLLADDAASEAFVAALCRAASRGVDVSVGADSLTYTEPKESFFAPHKRQSRAQSSTKLEKRLRLSGVRFQWLGRLSTIGFAGRTHTKWCVVDDTAFSFGGVNLDKKSFMNVDYMLRYDNAGVADTIYLEHQRILRSDKNNSASHSRKHVIDSKTTILVDGGIFGDSIIYRRACSLSRRSAKVTLVSQYCPTGRLARYLKKVDSAELYFNHWRKASWLNRLIIRLGMYFSKLTTGYHRRPYLHAKFIIFELKNGQKVALSGSHNFIKSSVLLGTREIAIETTDKSIIKQLEKFFRDYIV